MKSVLIIFAALLIGGCSAQKEVQVEFIDAELVKIDTIYRHPSNQQMLRWRSKNNVEFISFSPIDNNFIVGSKVKVMVKR